MIDPVTGLPHYLALLPSLERVLHEDSALGMILVHIDGLDAIEEANGPKAFDEMLRRVAELFHKMRGTIIRQEDYLAVSDMVSGASFMLFLSEKRDRQGPDSLRKSDVEIVSNRVQEYLYPQLAYLSGQYTKARPRLMVGHAFVVNNPRIRTSRLISRLVDDARDMARLTQPNMETKSKEQLQRIILEEQIVTLYQPIIHLPTNKVMGYEALTRGPSGTVFESPLMLFAIARDNNLLFELDRLCRRKALENAKPLPSDCKLFVNTLPNTIHDPDFRGQALQDFFRQIGRKPSDVVLEITERGAIDNFPQFKESVRHYTDQGMTLAMDDIGTGYSTLEAIVELNPRYLKFDISMVRGIGESPAKQGIFKLLSSLAQTIGAEIIAEGIENHEDLNSLTSMGLTLAQGFLFSKPMTARELVSGVTELKTRRRG